jgi:hypothetical protein
MRAGVDDMVPVIPPANLQDGALCSPPLTHDLDPIVYNASQHACGVWSGGVVCAHGGTVRYINVVVNPTCRHATGINQGLAVIATVATATALVAALPAIAVPLATTCSSDPEECEEVAAEAQAELDALTATEEGARVGSPTMRCRPPTKGCGREAATRCGTSSTRD